MNMLRSDITHWILSVPAVVISAGMITANLWITFGGLFKKRDEFQSLIPLIGGILGAIGLFILPVSHAWQFSWLPLVLDIGCGPLLVAALIDQIKKNITVGK